LAGLISRFERLGEAGMTKELFDQGPAGDEQAGDGPAAVAIGGGTPRLRKPQRRQVEMHWQSLDELLEPDHPARVIWAAVEGLDLSRWLQNIQAVAGAPGRDATDPRLLVAVWVYATLNAVGSARQLARLCDERQGQLGYRWLCGGVTLNHHTLSDFRAHNGAAWDQLVTQLVASLMHEGLVTMTRVAQDGMRVEANAGKSSFRRRGTLDKCLDEARQQVETLKQLGEEDPGELTKRERAARERAAREREQRVKDALANCDQLQKQREKRAKTTGERRKKRGRPRPIPRLAI
jgi:transposase